MGQEVAAVIIYDGGKILILKRGDGANGFPGFWNFPGGAIERGETPAEAAVREVKEETDIDISAKELSLIGSYPQGMKTIYIFRTNKFSGEIELNKESTEFAWVNPKEILDIFFIPIPSDVLKKIL